MGIAEIRYISTPAPYNHMFYKDHTLIITLCLKENFPTNFRCLIPNCNHTSTFDLDLPMDYQPYEMCTYPMPAGLDKDSSCEDYISRVATHHKDGVLMWMKQCDRQNELLVDDSIMKTTLIR